MAPYGILQSLTREADLTRTLAAVHRVLAPGGLFGIDLVPDVPRWREYERRLTLRGTGPRGLPIQLVETVRQDTQAAADDLRPGVHRGSRPGPHSRALLAVVPHRRPAGAAPAARSGAGFEVDAVLGDYDGRAWDDRADTWVVLARK